MLLSSVSCKSTASSDSTVRKDYQKSLRQLLKTIETTNDEKLIEFSIPINHQESLIYFSSDYDKELSKSFQALQQKTVGLCIDGKIEILKKYLNLSEFVDGYFAEDYFDSVEKIMRAQKELTCSILLKSDSNKTGVRQFCINLD